MTYSPLKPPKQSYDKLLHFDGHDKRLYVNLLGDKECLCCSSIICPGNWCPTLRVVSIIDEILANLQIRNQIWHIIINNLFKNYLPHYKQITQLIVPYL